MPFETITVDGGFSPANIGSLSAIVLNGCCEMWKPVIIEVPDIPTSVVGLLADKPVCIVLIIQGMSASFSNPVMSRFARCLYPE